jgi:hypothetical protein
MRPNPCLELYEFLKKRVEVAFYRALGSPELRLRASRLSLPETVRPNIHFFETLPDMTKLTI